MNATNFVKTFIEITPTKKDYQEKATDLDSIIDILVNNHKIGKKNVHTDVPEKDAILDLIFNYDVSSLEIQNFKFNKEDVEQKMIISFLLVGKKLFPLPYPNKQVKL